MSIAIRRVTHSLIRNRVSVNTGGHADRGSIYLHGLLGFVNIQLAMHMNLHIFYTDFGKRH